MGRGGRVILSNNRSNKVPLSIPLGHLIEKFGVFFVILEVIAFSFLEIEQPLCFFKKQSLSMELCTARLSLN